MIEINLNKLIGTHTAPVKVTRDGTTFYQQRRVGKKPEEKKNIEPNIKKLLFEPQIKGLEVFKLELEKMNIYDLIDYAEAIETDFDGVRDGITDWFKDRDMSAFDKQITTLFNLDDNKSRRPDKLVSDDTELDDETAYGLLKMYYVTQEFLKRQYPDGYVVIHRGVDGNTFKKFSDHKEGDSINLECYNVSSWTDDREIADSFAHCSSGGVIVEAKVPIDRIFLHIDNNSTHAASPFDDESEVVVIGNSVNGVLLKKYEGNRT